MIDKVQISLEDDIARDDVFAFAKECKECIALYAAKNHDYDGAFNKAMNQLGTNYAVGKLFDKMMRLTALCGKEEQAQVAESLDDTLRDMACYALMTLVYRHCVSTFSEKEFPVIVDDEEAKCLINAINGCSLEDKRILQDVLGQLKTEIE